MFIDHELIAQVQHMATGDGGHRVKTLIACYVGFVGMLDQYPELRERALTVERALRTFCMTGQLPAAAITPERAKKSRAASRQTPRVAQVS